MWYSMRNLAGDLSFGSKFVLTTNSPNIVHRLCSGQVGRIKVRIFGEQWVNNHGKKFVLFSKTSLKTENIKSIT